MINENHKDEPEYILCAAIRLKEPLEQYRGVVGSDMWMCATGYRHHDILIMNQGRVSKKPSDQGFLTSKGRFVSREEAMRIAYQQKQVTGEVWSERRDNYYPLFSEHLY